MGAPAELRPLLALAALALAGCDGRPIKEALPWQSFSVVSTSMEPTLRKGVYVTGVSVKPDDLKHGDLLVVRRGEEYWISRLAAKPGDTIALTDGIVVLNGKQLGQRQVGTWTITDSLEALPVRMLSERFPGEGRPHHIIDDGPTLGDDFAPITLPSDRYFLLGDNRDHSADSRYDGELFGLGLIKGADIVRRVDPDPS